MCDIHGTHTHGVYRVRDTVAIPNNQICQAGTKIKDADNRIISLHTHTTNRRKCENDCCKTALRIEYSDIKTPYYIDFHFNMDQSSAYVNVCVWVWMSIELSAHDMWHISTGGSPTFANDLHSQSSSIFLENPLASRLPVVLPILSLFAFPENFHN